MAFGCTPCCSDKTKVVEEISGYGIGDKDPRGEERSRTTLPDGSTYEGQWLGQVRQGRGRLERPHVGVFEGQFARNRPCGRGKFTKTNGDVYKGEWLDGLEHGQGRGDYSDGSAHEGSWEEGQKTGPGKEFLPDGSSFQGQFKRGQREGEGEYRGADGSTFKGQFWKDTIDGYGCYQFHDGRVFVGEWRQSAMEGQGRMDWPDGMSYEGQFENDKKHGKGLFIWPDGRQYDGQWLQGKMHGRGNYTDAQGRTWMGEWNQGQKMRAKVTSIGEESLTQMDRGDPSASSRRRGARSVPASAGVSASDFADNNGSLSQPRSARPGAPSESGASVRSSSVAGSTRSAGATAMALLERYKQNRGQSSSDVFSDDRGGTGHRTMRDRGTLPNAPVGPSSGRRPLSQDLERRSADSSEWNLRPGSTERRQVKTESQNRGRSLDPDGSRGDSALPRRRAASSRREESEDGRGPQRKMMVLSRRLAPRGARDDGAKWVEDVLDQLQKRREKQPSCTLAEYVVYNPGKIANGFCGKGGITDRNSQACRCRGVHPNEKQPDSCDTPKDWLSSSNGKPLREKVCWRYGFQWCARKARDNGGCLLQLFDDELDKAQVIEEQIAVTLGLPVFRLKKTQLSPPAQIVNLEMAIEADDRYV